MPDNRSAGKVFEEWAGDHRAPGMEKGHWPVVRQAFEPIPEMTGNYLEIGVGNGYSLHHMAANQFKSGRCYGIDLAPGMVELAEERLRDMKNVTVERADFLEWVPPPGVLFSLIFSMEVFYYFSDIQKGIEKAYSLLAPGGKLMVMVDYFLENDATLDWPRQLGAPMQLWSQRDYREGMEKAGFYPVEQRLFSGSGRKPESTELTLCTTGVKP
jgi:SAM-dependent methyltransferase